MSRLCKQSRNRYYDIAQVMAKTEGQTPPTISQTTTSLLIAERDHGIDTHRPRESGLDRRNFVRKLARGEPGKCNSYNEFVRWLTSFVPEC